MRIVDTSWENLCNHPHIVSFAFSSLFISFSLPILTFILCRHRKAEMFVRIDSLTLPGFVTGLTQSPKPLSLSLLFPSSVFLSVLTEIG